MVSTFYLVNGIDGVFGLSMVKLIQQPSHHWKVLQYLLIVEAAVVVLGCNGIYMMM